MKRKHIQTDCIIDNFSAGTLNGNEKIVNQEIKPLPERFTGKWAVKGFLFTQIFITNRVFCYEINVGGAIFYHVFKKVKNSRFLTISFPGPNAFGVWPGVTGYMRRLNRSITHFIKLNNNETNFSFSMCLLHKNLFIKGLLPEA